MTQTNLEGKRRRRSNEKTPFAGDLKFKHSGTPHFVLQSLNQNSFASDLKLFYLFHGPLLLSFKHNLAYRTIY